MPSASKDIEAVLKDFCEEAFPEIEIALLDVFHVFEMMQLDFKYVDKGFSTFKKIRGANDESARAQFFEEAEQLEKQIELDLMEEQASIKSLEGLGMKDTTGRERKGRLEKSKKVIHISRRLLREGSRRDGVIRAWESAHDHYKSFDAHYKYAIYLISRRHMEGPKPDEYDWYSNIHGKVEDLEKSFNREIRNKCFSKENVLNLAGIAYHLSDTRKFYTELLVESREKVRTDIHEFAANIIQISKEVGEQHEARKAGDRKQKPEGPATERTDNARQDQALDTSGSTHREESHPSLSNSRATRLVQEWIDKLLFLRNLAFDMSFTMKCKQD